jgi:nitrite reductase/ring-hydroxylating ferredoxin subunit
MNKRGFLRLFTTGMKALVLGIFSYPLLRFIVSKPPRLPVRIKVRAEPEKDLLLVENDFFLFPDPDGAFSISRECTHLGCRVNFSEEDGLLVCPCHGSRFTTVGKVIQGPALKNLSKLPVTYSRSEGYIVTLEEGDAD